MSFDANLKACAQLVEKGDPDRFAAAMATSVESRKLLFPLYAFNVEVSRAPWVTQEAMIAEMRLQWWKDALEEIAEGKSVRRHEVVTPLSGAIDAQSAQSLMMLVEARRWDIYRDPFSDLDSFFKYIEDTSFPIFGVVARAVGVEIPAIKDLAYASGLANFLRAVPELERKGRVPLVDGRPEAVRELAQTGLNRLEEARKARKILTKEIALAAWQAEPILQQVVREPLRVAEGRLGMSEFGKKSRLIWQAASGRW